METLGDNFRAEKGKMNSFVSYVTLNPVKNMHGNDIY